jgi:segregation and condensation protein B
VEALLFLSPEPVSLDRLAEVCEADVQDISQALAEVAEELGANRHGVVLRNVASGYTLSSTPEAETAARRLFSGPKATPLSQAQAECLAVVAYCQPVSRPELARIRGVSSESAMASLLERGLISEAGRSENGALTYKTTKGFEKQFGLESLDELPDPAQFDPSPQEAANLRERLLKAGDQRAGE